MPKDNSDKLKGQKPGTKGSGQVGQSGDLQQDQSGKKGRAWLGADRTLLNATLSQFTNGIKSDGSALPYDLHFLYTKDDDPVKDGYAWQTSLCTGNNFAIAALGSTLSFSLTTHEIGHTLGMTHDGPVSNNENGCESPDQGLMKASGGEGFNWSSCSKQELNTFIQSNPACLFQQNIPDVDVQEDLRSETLEPYWSGIDHSKDELCEAKAGPGFRFRQFPYDWGVCDIHSCVDMNPGITYGHMINFNPNAYGTYCGEGMMCMNSACRSATDSGLPDAALNVVAGGWGDWSSFTECSRTCGTGLRTRQRQCDMPRPKNTECEGLYFDAETCNTTPCDGDSSTKSTLINQRATETCTWLLENGMLLSTEYTASGTKYWDGKIGQCEVWCDPVAGFNYPQNVRHGLMPDGTPCTQDTYTMTYEEQKGFPRSRGFDGLCVLGYCEAFGCDGKPGVKVYDGCGVCGGTDSTCTIYEGVYTDAVTTGTRAVIATLPVGAYRIQFYNDFYSMENNFIELWSLAGNAIIAPYSTYNSDEWDTRANPKPAAGTTWSYLWYDQFLFADGPITEPVVIKLYNFGSNPNTGITYGYSVPLDTSSTLSPVATESSTPSPTAPSSTATQAASTGPGTSISTAVSVSTPTTTKSSSESPTISSTATVSSPQPSTSVAQTPTTPIGMTRNPNCPGGSLQCYDGKCISYRDICDGVQDCSQNEDENGYMDCSKYGGADGLLLYSTTYVLLTILSVAIPRWYFV